MSDLDLITKATSFPTLLGFFQLLTILVNPESRKGLNKLLNYRNLAAVLLSTSFWKLDAAFDFRTKLRRLFEGRAIIRASDDCHKWLMLFLTTHPDFQSSPKDAEITTKTLIVENGMSNLSKDKRIIQSHSSQLQRQGDDDRDKQKDLEITFKPAPYVTMHFVFQGTHFWARRERQESKDDKIRESLHVTYWSFSSAPLQRLLRHAQQTYVASIKDKEKSVCIYRMHKEGSWLPPKIAPPRTIDTLHLPGNLKEEIFSDARKFFSQEGMSSYTDRCVPYRRGILLYGPPGGGKSTLCHVLASELGEPLYVLNLGSKTIDDDSFLYSMSRLPPRCIVLIEDIDVAFVKRTTEASCTTEEDGDKKKAKKSGVSMSAVLNSLDGVDAPVGRLLCVTTNHIEKLEPALIRAGRIDKKYEIKNANREQTKELFLRWFTTKSINATEELHSQADTFAAAIPEYEWSIASLQNFLMECDNDSAKAVHDIEGWLKKKSEK